MIEAGGSRQPRSEVLKLDTYSGVYGRLFLASQAETPEKAAGLINPTQNIDVPISIDVRRSRKYDFAAGLSDLERTEAWEGVEPTQAYKEWRTGVAKAVRGNTDKSKTEALQILLPCIDSKTFTVRNADALFNSYCNGESDIDAFVRTVVDGLSVDCRVDTKRLTDLTPHLEWISRKLFGPETARVISRMIELEAEIRNKPKKVKSIIFFDNTRVNNLTASEIDMLSHLYQGLEAKPIAGAESVTPTVAPTPEIFTRLSSEEKVKTLLAAIETVRRGERPIDPTTGKPLMAQTQEQAIRYLKKKIKEAMNATN